MALKNNATPRWQRQIDPAMDALRLDYQIPSRRPQPLLLLLLFIGAIAAIVITVEYSRLQQQIDERSAMLQQLRLAHGPQPQPSQKEQRISAAMQKGQNDILARLSLPWVALFRALENAQDKKVALLTIEPNIKTGTVRLTAETGTLEQALAYLDRLQQQSALSAVTLIEHEIALETAGQPVRFTLSLSWRHAR